jgi:hypothetical protein
MQLLQILIIFKDCNKKIRQKQFRNFHQMMEAVDIIKLKKNYEFFKIYI